MKRSTQSAAITEEVRQRLSEAGISILRNRAVIRGTIDIEVAQRVAELIQSGRYASASHFVQSATATELEVHQIEQEAVRKHLKKRSGLEPGR